MSEWEFLSEVARRADCSILLDVNNIYVSARNHGFDPRAFIDGIPSERVVQMHLAGHSDCGTHLLDTHDAAVSEPVWELFVPLAGASAPSHLHHGTGTSRRSRSSRARSRPRVAGRRKPSPPGGHAMTTPPPLRELQLRLRELIFRNGDGTAAALERLERGAADLPIRGDERLSPGQRLSIYAGMHFLRIRDVLAGDFPATRAAAGDEFDRLVERYLDAHPTDDPSLRRAGRHLPGFLERCPANPRFAWQADLAALEWAMIEAFDALDEDVLTAAALEAVAPGDWPDLAIRPIRSLRLLELRFPVGEIRADLIGGAPPSEAMPVS